MGDTGPAGGLIFYINPSPTTWTYLEAAPSDTATSRIWGPYVNCATSTAIGSGLNNTNTVVSLGGTGSYGVRDCYILVLGGYSDWFMPPLDELNLMYTNLHLHIPPLGSFSGLYWSSSALDDATDDKAWYQSFTTGNQYTAGRLGGCNIRACRRF